VNRLRHVTPTEAHASRVSAGRMASRAHGDDFKVLGLDARGSVGRAVVLCPQGLQVTTQAPLLCSGSAAKAFCVGP
jgi:hypothetical protein